MIEYLIDAGLAAAVIYLLWRRPARPAPQPPTVLDPSAPPNPKSKVVRVRPRALPVVLLGLAVAQMVMWPWTAEAQVQTGPRVPSNCTDAQVLGGQADGSGVECQTVGLGELADDLGCTASQDVRRNGGDTGWECYTPAAGGSSGTGLQHGDGAGGFSEVTGSSSANGGIALVSQAAASVPLKVTGHASQSADYFQVGASSGTPYFTVVWRGITVDGATLRYNYNVANEWEIDRGLQVLSGGGLNIRSSTGQYRFSFAGGTSDTGLGAAAAKVTKFTDGSSGGGTWQAGDPGTRPTCDSTTRGRYWHDFGGAGVADSISACIKNSSDTYQWVDLATIP